LRELRKTVSCREEHTVSQHGQGEIADPLISPISSSSEYHSSFEEGTVTDQLHNPANTVGKLEGEGNQRGGGGGGRGDEPYQNEISEGPTVSVTGIVTPSPESNSTSTSNPGNFPWDIEFNGDTTAALNLNLVQKWTQKGRTCLTFSMDGKYLATASSLGIISIFDSKTGERIR